MVQQQTQVRVVGKQLVRDLGHVGLGVGLLADAIGDATVRLGEVGSADIHAN